MSLPSPNDDPRHLDWEAALAQLVERCSTSGRPRLVVGVTGPVGAGKSTFGRALAERTDGIVLTTDDYLPDYDGVPIMERDLPEHADLTRLASDLAQLAEGRRTAVPIWSFHDHRRTGERPVDPPATGAIVVEGIHALAEPVIDALDMAVFVRASAATRWARWEAIEQAGDRGMGVEQARAFFHQVADPTFGRFADAYLAAAHIVVTND